MDLKQYDHFKAGDPYYNGYRLLSMQDREGKKPEIYISTTNRSAGKTVFYNGYLLHRFIQKGEKFILLYRNKYEIDDAAGSFFNQVHKLFYPGLELYQEKGIKSVYNKLYLRPLSSEDPGDLCGYVTSLKASENIKKYSSLLADADRVLFDEAFPENDEYLPDEIQRFMSVHDSLARGGGSQSKYLPVLIVGNLINVFNPYYMALGVVDNLTISTNYLRGSGFVIEQGFNEASAQAHKESAFHQALSGEDYTAASQEKTYLNTSYQFIDNSIVDTGMYLCSIRYKNNVYSVRYNERAGFYYCSNTPDPGFKLLQAATEKDITEEAIYDPLSRFRKILKERYRQGYVRFKDLRVRDAILHYIIGK